MREAESDDLRRALIGQHVVVSDLAITEVTSAMHRLGREGVLTHAEVMSVLAAVHRGIEAAESFAFNQRSWTGCALHDAIPAWPIAHNYGFRI